MEGLDCDIDAQWVDSGRADVVIFLPREQQPTFRSGFETVENLTWAAQRYIGYGAKMSRR
ncbi:hypothetical protein BofuT4_uP000460.1 [Botrytis cinerea T4]|uniref:Uncharacterized protein n=1 Tax=Botryotinia fuckeliana (strain T4) TaxID=999810 RepID=G2YLV1_BOTF4|nr:hypothetical protein BofuT4_uP000460.1 [Botrytis cinerea T4]